MLLQSKHKPLFTLSFKINGKFDDNATSEQSHGTALKPFLNVKKNVDVKAHSHVTSVFAFFFDLCRPVLENVNVKCEHHHLLP